MSKLHFISNLFGQFDRHQSQVYQILGKQQQQYFFHWLFHPLNPLKTSLVYLFKLLCIYARKHLSVFSRPTRNLILFDISHDTTVFTDCELRCIIALTLYLIEFINQSELIKNNGYNHGQLIGHKLR